mmetsp:Transcript_2645/g.7660  ORF Transcript_2645/g.7660 Transcript_2645/m.7660 type:complete len:234 (-) Transcript_2645:52-753(-)
MRGGGEGMVVGRRPDGDVTIGARLGKERFERTPLRGAGREPLPPTVAPPPWCKAGAPPADSFLREPSWTSGGNSALRMGEIDEPAECACTLFTSSCRKAPQALYWSRACVRCADIAFITSSTPPSAKIGSLQLGSVSASFHSRAQAAACKGADAACSRIAAAIVAIPPASTRATQLSRKGGVKASPASVLAMAVHACSTRAGFSMCARIESIRMSGTTRAPVLSPLREGSATI